jgi:ABC-2 type transport system ATP-binding protein
VILDEPANGLDPEGIRWIRNLLRGLAAEGRTVFLSSHLMSEMSQTADRLIVIGRGRLIADTSVEEFVARGSIDAPVLVRAADRTALHAALSAEATRLDDGDDGALISYGLKAGRIGELALAAGLPLQELTPQQATLEEAFMELTHDSVEYVASTEHGGKA